ncbi:MAG: response regulator, partial [Anaerolineae bacterium]|nr:response regulator [Anaerolineae bacterium]
GVVVAWLAVGTLYTALQWMWNTQQQADQLLNEVRDHRAELSRVLKSYELANTLLRRTQRELISARKQAEAARRLKEQFAANISHELRTPLNLIMGFSEVMYLSPQVYGEMNWSPTLRRDVYHIYHGSRHLLGMIDDILDLSHFELTGFTLSKEATPLESLLWDTVEIAEDLFRDHPVQLKTEIAPDLPTLEIDRTRIRQVILNLLNNAQRFTQAGTVQLSAARQTANEVVISVKDTGPGIPADNLPHIFDEFYQVDRSLHRNHAGAGLGLAISKHFVEAHGGHIWVESEEGKGSTFFFTLPVLSSYFHLPSARIKEAPEPQWPESHPCILVVDPDPAVSNLVRRHLGEYDVMQVKDVDRLSEAIMLHHPQVVVCNTLPGQQYQHCDIAMPVPFIECSLPSHAWMANNLAVEACLTKPITAQQLLPEFERLGSIENILIIDDDRDFIQLVKRMLAATGQTFQVNHAYDGEEGLTAIRAQQPDLVLLDLILPNMDGFQVLEQMHHEPGLTNIPVILLTASSLAEDPFTRPNSQIVIHRSDGLYPAEVLSCLRAVMDVLEPHYDERSLPNKWMNQGTKN